MTDWLNFLDKKGSNIIPQQLEVTLPLSPLQGQKAEIFRVLPRPRKLKTLYRLLPFPQSSIRRNLSEMNGVYVEKINDKWGKIVHD